MGHVWSNNPLPTIDLYNWVRTLPMKTSLYVVCHFFTRPKGKILYRLHMYLSIDTVV